MVNGSPAADTEKEIGSVEAPAADQDDEEREAHEVISRSGSDVHDHAFNARNEIVRTYSYQSSVYSVKKVPRGQSAGWLGRFGIIYEAEEPKHYPRPIKWTITFIIALAAVAAPLGSSIILPALNDISGTFGSSHFITNFSVAFYMLSMSLFPLWWSSFSETTGRRAVYLLSFVLYMLFNVLAAVSTSIAMFIVMRVLSGGCSAAVQAVGAGTIADIWEVKERGRAMGIFYLGPLAGPLLAPVIGGGLTEGFGWRSTQWFQVIYGGVVLLSVILFLPETHKSSAVLLAAEREAREAVFGSDATNDAGDNAHASGDEEAAKEFAAAGAGQEPSPVATAGPALQPRATPTASLRRPPSRLSVTTNNTLFHMRRILAILRRIFLDPLKIVLYLRYPAVTLTILYASVAFGSLYFLNISVEKTFSAPPYNFKVILVGCLYIFNSTGYFLTSIFGGYWVDRIMHREAIKAGRINPHSGKPIYHPLDRFRENVYLAAVLMPASLMWYGWSSDQGVYWLCPMLANFCFGAGSMLLFGAATTMLTEMMPKQSSNGVALNNFVRNIFSFGGTFLAEPAIDAIGNGWLFTIIGLVALASASIIYLMRRYGEKWRERMDRELM